MIYNFCSRRDLIIILILSLFTPRHSSAWSHWLQSLFENTSFTQNQSLEYLLTERCLRDHHGYLLREGRKRCHSVAHEAVKLFEIKAEGDTSLVEKSVVFKDKLLRRFREPRTRYLIRQLNQTLEDRYRFKQNSVTLVNEVKNILGSTSETLEFFGVFLQDTTDDQYPYVYLREELKDTPELQEDLKNYQELLSALDPELLIDQKWRDWLLPYPVIKGANTEILNINIYHFYTVAYWAYLIRKKTKDIYLSYYFPLLLNYLYETRPLEHSQLLPWPFGHPLKDQPELNNWKVRDFYSGYLGAYLGSGIAANAHNFETFSKTLLKKGLHHILKLHSK